MGLFFVYSIKLAICLTVFYLFYMVLLSRETFHRFNRLVLISVMLVSLIIPFIHIEMNHSSVVADGIVAIEDLVIQGEADGNVMSTDLSPLQVVFLIYIIGVAIFLLKGFLSLIKLRIKLSKGRVKRLDNGVKLVIMNCEVAPFSWFNNIVISEKDYQENLRDIITHEVAHVKRWHSIDILVCNLLITFQWYNPAAWLLKKELQSIHEYEADEAVINQGIDAEHYQLLLIRKAVGERLFSLANNMNHNSLKSRIAMMKKDKSNPWNRMKAVMTIPVAAITVVAFACPKVETMAKTIEIESNEAVIQVTDPIIQPVAASIKRVVGEVSETQATVIALVDTVKKASVEAGETVGTVYDVVEQMPKFPGGMAKMMQYIAENTKYPEAAKANGVEGRVIVNFIVDTEGNIRSPKIYRSIDPELDAEALRVVSSIPTMTPGMQNGKKVNVRFTIPVSFQLNGSKEKPNYEQAVSVKEPVIYLDGKKITTEELKNIAPNTIEKIDVIKNESAVKLYGEEAHDGAIIITLKK